MTYDGIARGRIESLAVALAFVLILAGSIVAAAQETVRIRVVDNPRPVDAAVQQIEKLFGTVVTYEDTRYVSDDEIVDITAETVRDPTFKKRLFGRKTGSLDVTYRLGSDAVGAQINGVLDAVIGQANQQRRFGEFRVERVQGGHHVIPVAIKGKTGARQPYTSPLDARITMSSSRESALDTMIRLVSAITAFSGSAVKVGTMPLTRFERSTVSLSAQAEPAREVLWRVLQSLGPDLSWQLLCGVGEAGECSLNVHPVRNLKVQR
jgi:hypothetical protein